MGVLYSRLCHPTYLRNIHCLRSVSTVTYYKYPENNYITGPTSITFINSSIIAKFCVWSWCCPTSRFYNDRKLLLWFHLLDSGFFWQLWHFWRIGNRQVLIVDKKIYIFDWEIQEYLLNTFFSIMAKRSMAYWPEDLVYFLWMKNGL